MLLFVLALGCSGNAELAPYSSGGEWVDKDPGGGGGGGDSSSDSGTENAAAPVITDLSMNFEKNGETYIILGNVYYTDAQDDVAGGKLFASVTQGSGSPKDFTFSVVNKADIDPGKQQAYIDDNTGSLVFAVSPVDITQDYIVDSVQIKDAAGNTSGETAGEVLGGSYTGS